MNNLQCNTENHHNKKITTVCMDKNCKNKRFSCLLCLTELHHLHQKKSIEIDQINSFIEKERNQQNNNTDFYNYGQKQIIQELEKLSTLIDSLYKIIIEKIEILKQQNLYEYLKMMSNNQQGIEDWNRLIEGMIQYVEVDNCIIKLTKSNEGELNEMEKFELKMIKQQVENLQSMIKLYIQIDDPIQLKIRKLGFKDNRKHADIALIDGCTIKKTKTTTYTMAFANEGFDPKNQSYEFAFNIQNIACCVIVGVGNDEGNLGSTYLFDNFNSLGHGQYLINQGKTTYHHTDVEINGKTNGITSKAGDKIQIKYNHVTKILEFRKQSEQNTMVQMTITDMTKKLYPCACLHKPDDQTQLVEY